MPITTLLPYYLDELKERSLKPDGERIFLFPDGILEEGEGVVDSRERMITPDWFSPRNERTLEVRIDAGPAGNFYMQYTVDGEGERICGRTLYMSSAMSGARVEVGPPLHSQSYSGTNTQFYHVNSEGDLSVVEGTASRTERTIDGVTTPAPGACPNLGGATTRTTTTSVSPGGGITDNISGELSQALSMGVQLGGLHSAQATKIEYLNGNAATVITNTALTAIANALAGEAYGDVQGLVLAVTRETFPEQGNLLLSIARYEMQAWLGWLGSGSHLKALGNPSEEVYRDEFGTYNPSSPDLDSIPWRIMAVDDRERDFKVKFVATDGREWRITLTEYHHGSSVGEETLLTGAGGATAVLAKTHRMFFLEPREPGEDTDEVQVTKVEVATEEGWSEDQGAQAWVRVRMGEQWGLLPYPDPDAEEDEEDDEEPPTTVYATEIYNGATELGTTGDEECECSTAISGQASYAARRKIDPDNGLLMDVETLTNAGSLNGRDFVPFPDGYFPEGRLAAQPNDHSRTGDLDEGGNGCDFGDNLFPCPNPVETVTQTVPAVGIVPDASLGADPLLFRSPFVAIAPTEPGFFQVVRMDWEQASDP